MSELDRYLDLKSDLDNRENIYVESTATITPKRYLCKVHGEIDTVMNFFQDNKPYGKQICTMCLCDFLTKNNCSVEEIKE